MVSLLLRAEILFTSSGMFHMWLDITTHYHFHFHCYFPERTLVRPMSHLQLCRATLSCDKVAVCNCACCTLRQIE